MMRTKRGEWEETMGAKVSRIIQNVIKVMFNIVMGAVASGSWWPRSYDIKEYVFAERKSKC